MAPTARRQSRPPTIAYVGNFQHPFCTERHVEQALREMGWRVLRLQESRVNWRTIPRQVRASRARLLLWTRTWDVDHRDAAVGMAGVRAANVPMVSFHLDRWWGLDREYQITTEPFFRTDHVFTADGGHPERWVKAGVNHHWLPPGVSGPDCAPHDPDPRAWPHPVVFVGSHPYPHKEWAPYRAQAIETVRQVVGDDQFAVLPGLTPTGARRPAIRQHSLRQLYATVKIVLGDSCLAGGATHYWSDRIPETLGRGAFLIHPYVEGIEDWYTDGQHLALYPQGDWDALAETVRYWLAHDDERQKVAAAGRELVLGRDTYRHRMETVLATVGVTA